MRAAPIRRRSHSTHARSAINLNRLLRAHFARSLPALLRSAPHAATLRTAPHPAEWSGSGHFSTLLNAGWDRSGPPAQSQSGNDPRNRPRNRPESWINLTLLNFGWNPTLRGTGRGTDRGNGPWNNLRIKPRSVEQSRDSSSPCGSLQVGSNQHFTLLNSHQSHLFPQRGHL